MKRLFPQFDVDYIDGVKSLRSPQKTSLKRLADILEEVPLSKGVISLFLLICYPGEISSRSVLTVLCGSAGSW